MTDRVGLVRVEIKRLRKEVKDNIAELGNSESERIGLSNDLEIYDNILSFIDSMQEESVSEDLEKAACNYGDELDNVLSVGVDDDNSIGEYATQAFKAGANWQKQQMMKNATYGQLENGEDYLRIKCLSMGCQPQDDGKLVKLIIIKED